MHLSKLLNELEDKNNHIKDISSQMNDIKSQLNDEQYKSLIFETRKK